MFNIVDMVKMGAAAIAASVVVVLVFFVAVIPLKQYEARKQGAAQVVEQVTKRNEQAGKLAREAKQGVDACYDADGTWNQETGKCSLPPK